MHFTPVFDDEGEDLSFVLRNVRRNRLQRTRAEWANDWRTRQFCRLGLQILYEHHVASPVRTDLDGVRLFTPLSAEALARRAQETLADPRQADQVTAQRWIDTWGNQLAYTEDLICYLFRLAPHIRQLEEALAAMVAFARSHTMGDYLRFSADLWIEIIPWDGLIALQNLVKACLPGNPLVKSLARQLNETSRPHWVTMYNKTFSVYGMHPKQGATWDDIAETFYTCAEGCRSRVPFEDREPSLSNGETQFGFLLRSAASSICGVPIDELDKIWPLEDNSSRDAPPDAPRHQESTDSEDPGPDGEANGSEADTDDEPPETMPGEIP